MSDGQRGLPLEQGTEESLQGVLLRFTYRDEGSGFCVVQLELEGRSAPVTAVGLLPGAQPGESLRLTGRWEEDRRFGRQFRIAGFFPIEPTTRVGMERFLGSGLVPGIGPELAHRIVQRFGVEALEVIERQGERLREVPGIGPKRAAQILEARGKQRGLQQVMVFLQSHGIATGLALKIHKRYGARAVAAVRENPYRLADELFGVGFQTADRIAASLGVAPDSPQRLQAGLLHLLGQAADEGHLFRPEGPLLAQAALVLGAAPEAVEAALEALAGRGVAVIEETGAARAVYLRRLHEAEAGAAARLRGLLAAPAPALGVDASGVLADFERRQRLHLAGQQRQAVQLAGASRALVITGGPGTGKTTIVRAILSLFEGQGRRILLAAPTGRAARRLAEAGGREARTIHRLLEFEPRSLSFGRGAEHPLEADLLVVDEASMIDAELFHHLLQAVPPDCRLVLVGDADQLPSVGPGNVLRDLIRSGVVPVVTLAEIFRQAAESRIVSNAHRVRRGVLPEAPPAEVDSDFYLIEREEPERALETVLELVAERIPRRFGFDPLTDIQLLSPMHKGVLGVTRLNEELQRRLNPGGAVLRHGGRELRLGDRVMQLRNDYEREVFNGDLGRVHSLSADGTGLRVRLDERLVDYDAADLDELALAYACTIHKAQGSEYPAVVIPLSTQHHVMLQRNLLYTALTRARRLVVLVGSRRALAAAVRNARQQRRYTRLAERLRAGG